MHHEFITIVSGLPRSGTSMMMEMLEAGGMPMLTDGIRAADEDNPKGYYEFERVKAIEQDKVWLDEAQGKAVKMIAALLRHLPSGYHYRILFMRRNIAQVLASQREMLRHRGEATDNIADEKMADLFSKHVERVEAWLAEQPNIEVLKVDYGDVLANAFEQATRINRFLGDNLDVLKMAAAVDEQLYRQRL